MKALVYIVFSSREEMREKLEENRDKILAYCNQKDYIPLVILEVVGSGDIQKDSGKRKILQLARKRMINVVVLSDLTTLGRNISDVNSLLEILKGYDVKVDIANI